jgi:hypothetical protein
MASILDLIASFILGGAILMAILNANDNSTEDHYVYNGNTLVQEMLISTTQQVEGEFRNMGFGVPSGSKTILWADTSSITFLTDLNYDNGATLDTIRYYLGSINELASTQNDRDRLLHRQVNSGRIGDVGAVTAFKMRYLTQMGEVLTTPVLSDRLSEILYVEVSMEVQNPYALARQDAVKDSTGRNALYSSSMWQHTWLASQNLRR